MVLMGMASKYHNLKKMSREELIERYDEESRSTVVGTSYYLDELRHRDKIELLEKGVRHLEAIVRYCAARLEKTG